MKSICWDGDYPVTQPYLGPAVHCGIDIGCPSGTPIYAARAGTVERVQTGMVSVRVGNYRDFYLHGYARVGVGQAIAARQQVIVSGAVQVDPAYPLTGPHLHFEIQNGFTLPGAPPTKSGSPVDPVPVLSLLYGPAVSTLEDEDMVFIGQRHSKPATLRAFVAGASYRLPVAVPQWKVGDVAKGATIAFDGYVYCTLGVASPDVSGTAGAQPGTSYVMWHATSGQWVPDAYLDTSKLAGAPAMAIPVGEPMDSLFAPRSELPTVETTDDDDSAYATHKELADAIAGLPKPPTTGTIDGPLTVKLS